MMVVDAGIVVPFVAAFFFWTRGVLRHSLSDLAFCGVVFITAVVFYGYVYQYTMLTDIPWVALLVFAAVALVVMLWQRRRTPPPMLPKACTLVAVCLSVVLFVAEWQWNASSNSLLTISPYRRAGTWVFDEPRLGLRSEPFISGIPELIDKLVAEAEIPNAEKGFRLTFSARPFPDYQEKIVWRRRQDGGNWYYSEKYDMEGWLCPALFRFFKRAPNTIYVKAEASHRAGPSDETLEDETDLPDPDPEPEQPRDEDGNQAAHGKSMSGAMLHTRLGMISQGGLRSAPLSLHQAPALAEIPLDS